MPHLSFLGQGSQVGHEQQFEDIRTRRERERIQEEGRADLEAGQEDRRRSRGTFRGRIGDLLDRVRDTPLTEVTDEELATRFAQESSIARGGARRAIQNAQARGVDLDSGIGQLLRTTAGVGAAARTAAGQTEVRLEELRRRDAIREGRFGLEGNLIGTSAQTELGFAAADTSALGTFNQSTSIAQGLRPEFRPSGIGAVIPPSDFVNEAPVDTSPTSGQFAPQHQETAQISRFQSNAAPQINTQSVFSGGIQNVIGGGGGAGAGDRTGGGGGTGTGDRTVTPEATAISQFLRPGPREATSIAGKRAKSGLRKKVA